MKKISLIFAIIILLPFHLMAEQENRDNEQAFMMTSMLLSMPDGMRRNFQQIQQVSVDLTDIQRTMLFNQHQTSATLPLVLNLLLGFGIGSAVQNDIGGTLIGSLGDGAGILLVVFGVLTTLQSEIVWERVHGFDVPRTVYPNLDRGRTMIITGSIVLGVSRVAQIITPFVFTPRYNARLQQALNMGIQPSFSIAPTLDMNKKGDLIVAWGFSF